MAEDFERVGVQTVVEGISKFERDIGKYNTALDKMAKATKQSVAVIRKQAQFTKTLEKAAFAVAKELKKVQVSEQIVAQSAKKVVAVFKTQLQYTTALEKAAFAVAKELKKVQASEQAVTQSTKVATKEVRDFTAAQSEMLSVSAAVSKQTEATAEANEDVNAGLKKMVREMAAQGAAVKDIAGFFNRSAAEIRTFLGVQEQTASGVKATTTAVKDANAAWANLVKGISTAAKMQQKQVEAQKKQNVSIGATIKKLGLWALGARSVYTVYSKLRRELSEAFKELYGQTEAYKELTTAVDDFWKSIVVALASEEDMLEALRTLANAVNWASEQIKTLSALTVGMSAANDEATGSMNRLAEANIRGLAAAINYMGPLGGILGLEDELAGVLFTVAEHFGLVSDEVDIAGAAITAGQERMAEMDAQLAKLGDTTTKYSSQIRSMVSAMRRWEQASAAIAAKAGEIEAAYEQAVGVALGDLAVSQMKVQTDLADTITDVHGKAAKDRAKAIADSQHSIERTVRQSQDNLAKAQEQHAIQMAHQRQRYNLSMIQSERMYLYQRGQLIAEGDVLALEDLDARHELEQEAREENFAMQERQAEELFQMQMRYQEQAIREQVAALRDGLTEQLREIKAREDEEIASAQAAAAEKEAQAKEEYATALTDAEAAAIEQREAQEEEQQKLLESTAQTLADMVATTDLTTQQVLDAWHAVNGPDQALDQLVKQFVARDEEWTQLIGEQWGAAADTSLAAARRMTDGWATSLAAITAQSRATAAAVAAIGGGGLPGGRLPRSRIPRARQYGGEDVISTPTTFMAGETGPERVVVQPLSSIGNMSGSFGLGWHGGPIPVQGSGLQGADTSGLGDAIAQGLLVEMRKQLLGYSGQRGY